MFGKNFGRYNKTNDSRLPQIFMYRFLPSQFRAMLSKHGSRIKESMQSLLTYTSY